jgi:hypothetical protein
MMVSVDGTIFLSGAEAAKVHRCSVATIFNRIRSEKFPNYKKI